LVSHYFNDIPSKNYNYIFDFVKVMPVTGQTQQQMLEKDYEYSLARHNNQQGIVEENE